MIKLKKIKLNMINGEDLGYKPDVIQKAKFECSPLGQVFNKGLDEGEEKEGLLKRLKNIEDQSKVTEENRDNQLSIKSIDYTVREELSQEAKNILDKFNNQEKLLNYKKIDFKRDVNLGFYFSD